MAVWDVHYVIFCFVWQFSFSVRFSVEAQLFTRARCLFQTLPMIKSLHRHVIASNND